MGPGTRLGPYHSEKLVARIAALAMFGEVEAVDFGLVVDTKADNRPGDHQDDGAHHQRPDYGDGDQCAAP